MAEKFYLITEERKKLLLSALHDAIYMVSDDIACGVDSAIKRREEYEKLEVELEKMKPRLIDDPYIY